jgi:hypothetical protein
MFMDRMVWNDSSRVPTGSLRSLAKMEKRVSADRDSVRDQIIEVKNSVGRGEGRLCALDRQPIPNRAKSSLRSQVQAAQPWFSQFRQIHARLPCRLAELQVGRELWPRFACESEAISYAEQEELTEKCRRAPLKGGSWCPRPASAT